MVSGHPLITFEILLVNALGLSLYDCARHIASLYIRTAVKWNLKAPERL